MSKPQVPSDPDVMGIRLRHPTDPTKIIQLELADTGAVIDGIEVWRLTTGGPGGPAPVIPSENKHSYFTLPDALAHQLPSVALVAGGVLIADDNNVGNIVVGGDNTISATTAPSMPPGTSIPIAAQNLNQIWVRGTMGDIVTFLGG